MEYDDQENARRFEGRTREFVDHVVLPVEREHLATGDAISADVIAELREEARSRELYAPQVSAEYGGQGLAFGEVLPAFEQVGRSLVGASAIRAAAPDEGNMHTLEMVGTEEQKEVWLRPLVAGEINSGFSMTEPQPGAGSDPKMIRTTAEREGDEWVIDGHKWWTSRRGGPVDVLLVLARTDPDAHPYDGCSIVLVPADTPGVNVVRNVPHLGEREITEAGLGHAVMEIVYDGVRVPVSNTLGEEDGGFAIAQRRLGPARLTHCMRFAGMARRALDVAKAYTAEREAFGSTLAEKQALRHRIADAETNLHAARTMVRHAARRIAGGDEARIEVAMSKVFTANVVDEIVDLSVQACGANGIGRDLPLAYFYEVARAFRIVDGADEVHRRTIARAAFDDVAAEEVEHVLRYGG